VRAWPRLRQWIDTDRAGNLIRQELDDAAVWDREGHDTAGLYRGSRLEAARTWAANTHEGDLSLGLGRTPDRPHQRRQIGGVQS
jgi:hypothetical protein